MVFSVSNANLSLSSFFFFPFAPSDNVELSFSDAALREIARVAFELNRTVDNIGARRLNTVIQRWERIWFGWGTKMTPWAMNGVLESWTHNLSLFSLIRIMDEYSFTAADLPSGTKIDIDVDYIREKVQPLMKGADLRQFVL